MWSGLVYLHNGCSLLYFYIWISFSFTRCPLNQIKHHLLAPLLHLFLSGIHLTLGVTVEQWLAHLSVCQRGAYGFISPIKADFKTSPWLHSESSLNWVLVQIMESEEVILTMSPTDIIIGLAPDIQKVWSFFLNLFHEISEHWSQLASIWLTVDKNMNTIVCLNCSFDPSQTLTHVRVATLFKLSAASDFSLKVHIIPLS